MSVIEITTSDNKKAYIYSGTDTSVYINVNGKIDVIENNFMSPHAIIGEDFILPGGYSGHNDTSLIKALIVHDNFDNIPKNIISMIEDSLPLKKVKLSSS